MSQLLSPGIVLAVLLVLIGAQVTRVVVPGRGPYVWSLALAVVGLIAGELIALSGHLQGPALGVLHPLPDALAMALAETAGALVVTSAPLAE
jgi:hypothetical protein